LIVFFLILGLMLASMWALEPSMKHPRSGSPAGETHE
jgi:hypothetical protein